MTRKSIVDRIINWNRGRHMEVLRRVQGERIREEDAISDIEQIKAMRKNKNNLRKGD